MREVRNREEPGEGKREFALHHPALRTSRLHTHAWSCARAPLTALHNYVAGTEGTGTCSQ